MRIGFCCHGLLWTLLWTVNVTCLAGTATPDFSDAAAGLQRAIEDRAFPGCAVVVGTDKDVLWSAAFGHLDYSQKNPVTRDTIYDLASVTKVAGTTSVLMRLVALGRISVDDPLGKYLPEFIEAASDEVERARRKTITINHLLTHTAGLPSWKPLYRSINSYAELLEAILKTPLEVAPGERFRYSDLGMILLGEAASRAGGKLLPVLERELVFETLNMTNTMRNPPARLWPRIPPTEKLPDSEEIVHGVVHDENARAGEGVTGHAGLFSTAEDLGRLARELLLALEGRSKWLPQSVAEWFTRKAGVVKDSSRALGWGVISERESARTGLSPGSFGHIGFTGTSMWIDPERKLFIILLTNRVHPTRDNDKIGKVRSELAKVIVGSVDKHAESK